MLNILILENNEKIYKDLINKIQSANINARLFNISFLEDEAIEILNHNSIDIFIINLEICSEKIFNFIYKKGLNNYKKSIIAYSAQSEKNNYLKKYNNLFYKTINSNNSINLIYENLYKLVILKSLYQNKLTQLINSELEKLSFDFGYNGTKFLSECIFLIYPSSPSKFHLNNDIYPIIAKKNNTSCGNIKVSIFQVTNIVYENHKSDKEKLNILEKYFRKIF